MSSLIALGLQAGPPAAAPADEGTASYRIRPVPREQRAPLAFELVRNQLTFRMKVADRDVWALLDTGCTSSLVDLEFARAAGLHVGTTRLKGISPRGEFVNLPVSGVRALVPGQIEVSWSRLPGADLGVVSKALDRDIEFILGEELLHRLVVLVDPQKKTIAFGPGGAGKPPLHSREIAVLPGRPAVELKIGSQTARMLIDTGFSGDLVLTYEAWDRIVPKDAATGTVFAGGLDGKTHAVRVATLTSVGIGPLAVNDVRAQQSTASGAQDGFIGMGILGRFRFALDLGQRKLWLHPLPGETE